MTKNAKSLRQFYDEAAKERRTSNIELLEGAEKIGWIPPRKERASAMRGALSEFGFDLEPSSGWEPFLYEMDLIFVALPDRTDERNIGHAGLAAQIERETQELREASKRITVLSHNTDFHWGAYRTKVKTGEIHESLRQATDNLERIGQFLRESKQKPRWRDRAQRKFRVGLATKLTTLFEDNFGIEAKPAGGSNNLPIEETNHWTRFFQACAFMLLGERISPDRQAVLWEAHGDR